MPTASYWAATGVRVQEGKHYAVTVVDYSSVRDWFVKVRGLEGWPPGWWRTLATPLEWARRRPQEPWFALIATVDRRHPVRLRADRLYRAPATGELVCYFNDTPLAYWNNRGVAKLRLVLLQESKRERQSRQRPRPPDRRTARAAVRR